MNRRMPLFVLIGGVVLVVLAVVLLVMPKRGEVSDTQEQLATAQDQEQELQLQLAQLEAARDAAPETNRKIREIETLIPPTVDEPGLILLLQGAQDRAGVDMLTISPSQPTISPAGTFSVVSTSLDITGTYFAIEKFLYNLETLPRAAKVLSITVAPGAAVATDTTATTETTAPTTAELSAQIIVEMYTTDLDSGPGSEPGPQSQAPAEGA